MSSLQTLTNLNLVQSVRKTSLVVTGWLCTIGGLVADVLQPIAPFAFYLFVASAVGLIAVTLLYWRANRDLLGLVAAPRSIRIRESQRQECFFTTEKSEKYAD
jgi:hypothetical protein